MAAVDRALNGMPLAPGGLTAAIWQDSLREAYRGTKKLVVLCSSDARYTEEAAAAAKALKAAGAQQVWLAGRPGDLEAPLRAAGVDEFVYVGQDVIDVLTRALEAA